MISAGLDNVVHKEQRKQSLQEIIDAPSEHEKHVIVRDQIGNHKPRENVRRQNENCEPKQSVERGRTEKAESMVLLLFIIQQDTQQCGNQIYLNIDGRTQPKILLSKPGG